MRGEGRGLMSCWLRWCTRGIGVWEFMDNDRDWDCLF